VLPALRRTIVAPPTMLARMTTHGKPRRDNLRSPPLLAIRGGQRYNALAMSRRRKAKQSRPQQSSYSIATARQHSPRYRVLSFVVIFVVLVIVGSAGELYMIRHQLGSSFQAWVARSVATGLSWISIPARVHDTTLTVGNRSVVVAVECTGIRATAIFWAGVLGFPCSWRGRFIGLLTGLVGVGLLNMLRIALLGVVAGYWSAWFDSVHAALMQGFLVIFVAPLWIFWMIRSIKHDDARQRALTGSPTPA